MFNKAPKLKMQIPIKLISIAALIQILFVWNAASSLLFASSLNIGVASLASAWHPFKIDESKMSFVDGLMFQPVWAVDEEQRFTCQLCLQDPDKEQGNIRTIGSGSKRQYRFYIKLKEELMWGDGIPLTGYDFLYAWKLASSIEYSSPVIQGYQHIRKIVVDPREPKNFFVFTRYKANILYELRYLIPLPKHREEEVWNGKQKSSLEGYFNESNYSTNPHDPGLYYTPYYPKRMLSHSFLKAEFLPNPYYQGAQFTQVNVLQIKDPVESIRQGRVHMVEESAELGENLENLLHASAQIGQAQVKVGDSVRMQALILNLRSPLLRDHLLREFLNTALDREEIQDKNFGLMVQPAYGVFHPRSGMFDLQAISPFYSPAEAKALLEKAGWVVKEEKNLKVLKKQHRFLKLSLSYKDGIKNQKIAQSIAQQLTRFGVQVQLEKFSQHEFKNRVVGKGDYRDLLLVDIELPTGFSLRPLFHIDSIPTTSNYYSGRNLSKWNSSAASHLIAKLEKEVSYKALQGLASTIQKKIRDDAPLIPLHFYYQAALVDRRLINFRIPIDLYPSSIHIAHWKFQEPNT